jgi:hypothetical protein
MRVTFLHSGYKQRNISIQTQKSQRMKKLFIVLAVASLGFVACNNDGETKTTTDSTTKDSTVVAPVVPADTTTVPADTTKKVDSTTAAPAK